MPYPGAPLCFSPIGRSLALLNEGSTGASKMMTGIFAALVAAFAAVWWGQAIVARLALALCFCLAIGLFLWEIYSPQYGFAMPWLQF